MATATTEQSAKAQTTSDLFPILETERAVIVGKNGSGKSVLSTALLTPLPYVVVIDPKAEFDLPGGRVVTRPRDLNKIKAQNPEPILYRPSPEFWDVAIYNDVFRWIYERKNCTLAVDEMYAVMDGTRAPSWLEAIFTRGRSRRIRTICLTQRPFRIPLTLLSEAQHYFCFELAMRDDLKRMAELMGQDVMQEHSTPYSFYYHYTRAAAGQLGHGVDECELQL